MSNSKDSVSRTVMVALVLCVVCSVIVSAAAVGLRDKQVANAINEKKMNILAAAGIEVVDGDLDTAFATITPKLVDMRTGQFSTNEDVATYDMRKAAKDPAKARALTGEQDIASIRKQSLYSTVYLVEGEQGIERIILPIHGYGLWSTLYGFIALEGDLNTVVGLGFYEHAETPGLGGEVDNPKWKALWPGKKVYAPGSDVPAIGLIKGNAPAGDLHKIDGLAGATLTSNGVTNLVKFWLGENGFATFLTKLKAGEA
ncbi:MAG: Na(+)-translocating NADH-quinone reductase subunit C [Oceanospirillaceae bacterium]|jgi:Na+-transporting NADH:ubiquinone oxidoreductase subunit C|nr:Na(+)-translocating NADH-quinone reductase subunit C [Oceanospirillaceae bacterium]MBT4443935.1 Na(+)-translocating NADH-quinone reductase subunit C [Oceanospirillaceae bacterium]MBT6076505.1 Na(+)-translocating NADH-quinone reductase subunit C [Oceanospirillaceae bacterium]MBT7330296.1 Na(+)-translocating NADH-quinone reductase subunit C [Oceanospirillaceae bacterium]